LRPRPAAETIGSSGGHCWLMRRDLDRPVTPGTWPEKLAHRTFTPQAAPDIHRLVSLCYQDDSGSVANYATWLRTLENDPEFDSSLCHMVWDESGLVAVIQCWTSAFIKDLVVHPRARRQGVGLALLKLAFETFALRGEGWVDLKVVENNVNARRLYERAGMRYVQREPVPESDLA
jgi:ribosomal protein S18 acetylase RimI-like enzyme